MLILFALTFCNLGKTSLTHENVIRDDYTSLEEIDNAVKEVGLERSQLIFGIDYTISNLETGKNSFNGLSLHSIQEGLLNPYQSVRLIVMRKRKTNFVVSRSLLSLGELLKNTTPTH